MQDHIGVMICIDRDVPLEVELTWLGKPLHLEATWHIAPYPASTRVGLYHGWSVLGPQRDTDLLALDFAGVDVDVILFDNAFGLPVFFEALNNILARWIGPKRPYAAGLLHAGPMAMTVDMRGIKTVFGSHAPVALDLIAHHRVRHQVLVPETWLQVFVDVHWRTITNPDKNDLVLLKGGIHFEAHLADQGTVSFRQNLDQLAITPVVCKAVEPTG